MKRIKMMLMAMVAVLAVGAVGASAASAGTGNITIDTSNYGTVSCDFTFAEAGWVSNTNAISGIAPDNSAGHACTVTSMGGSGTITRAAGGSGAASFAGVINISTNTPLGAISCSYDPVTLSGSYSGTAFTFNSGSASYDSGSLLCPDAPLGGTIDSVSGSVTTAS